MDWGSLRWEYVCSLSYSYFSGYTISWRRVGKEHYADMQFLAGMDLNPRRFETPFENYEFAHHVLDSKADLVLMPMAWLTSQPQSSLVDQAQVPDADTLAYWIQRLQPVLDKGPQGRSEETIFVTCNRIGVERGASFAGTSVVVGVSKGNIKVYGCLGRGTEDLLVCEVPGPGKNSRRR
jgi:protein N-terminal amidase